MTKIIHPELLKTAQMTGGTPDGANAAERLQASDMAERFMLEWTCSESIQEIERDSWLHSDVHSLLVDFILLHNIELSR